MQLTRNKVFTAGAILLVVVALGWIVVDSRPAQADPTLSQSIPSAKEAWGKFHYQEAAKCTQCHGLPLPLNEKSWDLCSFMEWPIWKTQDKHAQAYVVLEGERGQKIAELLYPKLEKSKAHKEILQKGGGCLGCHAMASLPGEKDTGVDPKDGVSCGGCHGPSSGWLTDHADKKWRELNSRQKFEKGMRDLRDPVIRAELCMSCHIGNAREGKVVSHAMMAAGHPPLPPFEVAGFSSNQPQHWRDPKYVKYLKDSSPEVRKLYGVKNLDFHQTEIALIGAVVAVRETARLMKDRTNFTDADARSLFPELAIPLEAGNTPKERWVEIALAHSDCFSCHHDLRYPGFRQERGFSYNVPGLNFNERVTPGRPMVRLWPLTGLPTAALPMEAKQLEALKPLLSSLTRATNVRPFGNPESIGKSADGLITWSDEVLKTMRASEINRDKAREIARALTNVYTKESSYKPAYESACQIGALLIIVLTDLGVKSDDLKALRDGLNLGEPLNRDKRNDEVMKIARQAIGMPLEEKMKDFLTASRNLNAAETEKLKGNQFLLNLFGTLSNDQFTAGLLKKETADLLQRYGDEEQGQILQTISNYSPEKFYQLMEQTRRLIP